MIIDDAPGTTGGLPALWAWVAIDAMDGEGLVGGVMPGLGSTPFVTGKEQLAKGPMATLVQRMPPMGRRYELRRYVQDETVETIDP